MGIYKRTVADVDIRLRTHYRLFLQALIVGDLDTGLLLMREMDNLLDERLTLTAVP